MYTLRKVLTIRGCFRERVPFIKKVKMFKGPSSNDSLVRRSRMVLTVTQQIFWGHRPQGRICAGRLTVRLSLFDYLPAFDIPLFSIELAPSSTRSCLTYKARSYLMSYSH
jgi:hypothetical protein